MELEDFAEGLVWGLPFLLIAGVFYAIARWKRRKGEGLYAQAKQQLSSGGHVEARESLVQALWKANEEPQLEREILADMQALYARFGMPFSTDDYGVLIDQYERLSMKESQKAFTELKKVQLLKLELIRRMPAIDS